MGAGWGRGKGKQQGACPVSGQWGVESEWGVAKVQEKSVSEIEHDQRGISDDGEESSRYYSIFIYCVRCLKRPQVGSSNANVLKNRRFSEHLDVLSSCLCTIDDSIYYIRRNGT